MLSLTKRGDDMDYVWGLVFLAVSIWQFVMTKQAFTKLKQKGNENTSPFMLLSLAFSLLFAIIFFVLGLRTLFGR